MLATKRLRAQAARFMLASLSFLFSLAWPLRAQGPPEVSEIFRKASEAMRQGDLNAAGDAFAAAAKAAPAFAEAHFNLGLVREEQGRMDEAIASLQKALALKPRLHGGNLFLAVAYYRMSRFEPALTAIRKETLAYPNDASAWMWLGVIRLGADQPEEAAIKAAPQQPGLHEELGTEYWKMNKIEEAEAEFKRELEIDPHSMLATYKLGSLLVEGAKPVEGKPLIEAALRQDPNLKEAYYYLARAYMQLGNDSEALDALKKAIAVNPSPEILAQAWYQLALVYRRLRRMPEAQQALATFQKLKDQESEHRQQELQRKLEKQNPQ